MNQLKLIEKILTNNEYREKVVDMSIEDFKAALAQQGLNIPDAEELLRKLKETISVGELSDSDLESISGGRVACTCKDEPNDC